jgi:PadR family transcriptional regulator, regulatory protein AphA
VPGATLALAQDGARQDVKGVAHSSNDRQTLAGDPTTRLGSNDPGQPLPQAPRMQEVKLTPTSYIVLGLLERIQLGTSYDLKRAVAETVGSFWSVPHSALYAEPERLERAGYLRGKREESGRRRKRYRLTARGRKALDEWRLGPVDQEMAELRDAALLRVVMGADPARLAATQTEAHRRKLAEYERRRTQDLGTGLRGPSYAVDAGIAHERAWVRFWSALGCPTPKNGPPPEGSG